MNSTPIKPKSKTKKNKSVLHQDIDADSVSNKKAEILEGLVWNSLGKPNNLLKIRCTNVFSDRWRVDIYCTFPREGGLTQMPDVKISDSFFIIFRDNEIFSSDPKIEKRY